MRLRISMIPALLLPNNSRICRSNIWPYCFLRTPLTNTVVETKIIILNRIDLFMGGGLRNFIDAKTPLPGDPTINGSRIDGRNLVDEWIKKRNSLKQKAKFIKNKNEMNQVNPDDINAVLGMYANLGINYQITNRQDHQVDGIMEITSSIASKTVETTEEADREMAGPLTGPLGGPITCLFFFLPLFPFFFSAFFTFFSSFIFFLGAPLPPPGARAPGLSPQRSPSLSASGQPSMPSFLLFFIFLQLAYLRLKKWIHPSVRLCHNRNCQISRHHYRRPASLVASYGIRPCFLFHQVCSRMTISRSIWKETIR